MSTPAVHGWSTLLARHASRAASTYAEHVRAPAMSVGTYIVPAGAKDPQEPHQEDEVYVVVRGRGRLRIGSDTHDVAPGSVAFVPARAPHRFEDVTEDLEVVVVFAPAETTPSG